MKFKAAMLSLFLVMGSVLVTSSASAADDPTIRLEPGVAVPLNKPQTDHYNAGAAMTGKLMLGITPWLDVDPSATIVALSKGDKVTPGGDVGTAWAFGAGARIKRPHDASNTGHGWSAASPWLDADLLYVRTGDLNRLGWQAGLGVSFPTSDSRWLWVGPFARFQQVTDGASVGGDPSKDTTDSRVGILGISFEFGNKQTPKQEVVVQTLPPVKQDEPQVVVERKPVEELPINPPVMVEVHQQLEFKVQFDFDSAKLNAGEPAKLDELIAAIHNHPGCAVVVEGHASYEGHPWAEEHNLKLSAQRAETVVAYLIQHGALEGAQPAQISAKGFGTKVPIADNSTAEGRAANRRVEFNVVFTLTFAAPQGDSK